MKKFTRASMLAIALLLGLALLFTACSNDSGPASTDDDPTTTEAITETQGQEEPPIDIVFTQITPGDGIGEEEGEAVVYQLEGGQVALFNEQTLQKSNWVEAEGLDGFGPTALFVLTNEDGDTATLNRYGEPGEESVLIIVKLASEDPNESLLFFAPIGLLNDVEAFVQALAAGEEVTTEPNGEETTGVDETTEEGATLAPVALPQGNAAILAEYTRVMDAIKTRQPTYTSINFQRVTNERELPPDVLNIFNTYFWKYPDSQNLFPDILTDIIDTRQLQPQNTAPIDRREHRRGENGERLPGMDSNARWIGASRNNRGSLATMSHVRSISVRELGEDRRQIDITIADARNPRMMDAGATTAPNAIAAFMEVQDIAEIFELLNNFAVRTAAGAVGLRLSADSYVHYSGSTIRAIYNPRTMEAESIYKVGRMTLNLDGSVSGVSTTGHPIKVDAIFDFKDFDWSPAWPA